MRVSRRTLLGVASIIAAFIGVLGVGPAAGGPNMSTDLAGMYVHIVTGPIAGATGPFSTVFFLSNTTSNAINVNVKCYNDGAIRVGPAAGSNRNLAPFDVDQLNPVSLDLTGDPAFTGLGWCYFAETTAGTNDFAVTIAMGIQGVAGSGNAGTITHPIFTSNASRAIAASTAQASVSDDDANVPFWHGSNWRTWLILLNPTSISIGTVEVDVYGAGANLLGTADTGVSGRDMDVIQISDFGDRGTARLGQPAATRGYMGWVFGVNDTSLEAIFYDLPVDKDDDSILVAGDRP